MLAIVLVSLAALAPAVAIARFILLAGGRVRFPGEMARRLSQVGATFAFIAAVALLGLSLGIDVYGRLSFVRLSYAGFGVLLYFLASIWWAWAWCWPIRPTRPRWWIIWAPAAPWAFLFLFGLTAALDPVELPGYMVVVFYALICGLGVTPIGLGAIWLRVGPDIADDVS